MKKYLLSLLVVGLTFIGFSNAGLVSTVDYTYSDVETVSFPSGILKIVVKEVFQNAGNWIDITCPGQFYKPSVSVGDTFELPVGYDSSRCDSTVHYGKAVYAFTIENPYVSNTALSSVISGLFSVFGELIPYVIYIGIGMLLVTLGFYAIRWLVNWLYDKIRNKF